MTKRQLEEMITSLNQTISDLRYQVTQLQRELTKERLKAVMPLPWPRPPLYPNPRHPRPECNPWITYGHVTASRLS